MAPADTWRCVFGWRLPLSGLHLSRLEALGRASWGQQRDGAYFVDVELGPDDIVRGTGPTLHKAISAAGRAAREHRDHEPLEA